MSELCGATRVRPVRLPALPQEFKSYAEAKKIADTFSERGYFYTGHPWLGISDALVETVLLLRLLSSAIGWASGDTRAGTAAVVFGARLAVEKVLSVYQSLHFVKEYLPHGKPVRVLGPIVIRS